MAQQQQGLFDTRSQTEILNDRWREGQVERLKFAQQTSGNKPGEQSAGAFGAMLAGALGKRFMPPQLTPEEEARTRAITLATTRTRQWKTTHPDASAEDIGLETQRHLAEELLREGDMQGIQIAQSVAEQVTARARAQAEMRKLDGDIDINAAHLRSLNWDFEKNKSTWERGGMVNIWRPDEDSTSGGHQALISNEGPLTATYIDQATGQPVVLTDFYSHPPTRGLKDWNIGDLGIPDAEARERRDQAATVMGEAQSAMAMADILQESVDESGQINWLAESGSFQNWLVKWSNNLSAATRAFDPEGSYSVEGVDMSTTAAQRDFVTRNAEAASAIFSSMPDHIRKNAQLQQRWSAAITGAAYLSARASEPGARNVTEGDFANAIITLAGYTSDPETFRRVTLDRVNSHITALENRLGFYEEDVQRKMLADRGFSAYTKSIAEFRRRYAPAEFGSGANPGPGLRGNALIRALLDPDPNGAPP